MTSPFPALFARVRHSRAALHIALLAALAYIPALTAAPGRMPADTKLYLYFDPWRLTTDAPFAWDSRQFAGWVPHQTVSYLWPSGPWYSTFEWLGVPDWVAQRLWIATLMFVAGLGARWAAKHLGIAATGALVVALFYQLSPYLLPYVSRTSAMLLPWAGLGWLIALTIRAATRGGWRDVGVFGLVIATVAAPNATAILMIAPAPALWLLHAAWGRLVSWRQALVTAAKIGAISIAASLWWIAMLSVQGKFGADVLGYSESLEAVSFTSTSTEVLRGMGYWLFYVRDPIGFATTAAYEYMSSGRLIAISFAVLAIGLLGLTITRWTNRRYAVLLVFVGVVLAVGVHPIDDPSPLMSPFAENSRSSIALALRSSTRAMPLSTLGIALGAGALIAAVRRGRWRWRAIAPWLAGAIAILNLPVLFNGGLVDPNLERDQDPPQAWVDASAALDHGPPGYRVLQVPGTEFGTFRWGYTVDPPLPGLSSVPLVTRDLLPLGSPTAMDLVYALDDRFQEGWAELPAVAPIARLLGVETVWLPNDVAFERFRTPRPELTDQFFAAGDAGLGSSTSFGEPQQNLPAIAMIDEQSISEAAVGAALAPVVLVPIIDPETVVRLKTEDETVVLAGSADGLVDAAAAGLLSGHELIRYAADHDVAIDDVPRVIVTDSNRDRAHQWHTAQDVWGFTEDGSDQPGVLRFDSADQRTPVFDDPTSADMTIASQRGPVHAAVSAYGEPFAYRPENRAAMAVDGDVATQWVVADRYEPVGEYIELTGDDPITELTLVQPQDQRNRWISRVAITDAAGTYHVELDESSRRAAGQVVALRAPSTTIVVTIDATETAPGTAATAGLDAVGFAEIGTNLGSSEEVVRVPANVLSEVDDTQALDIVLTRLRTRPTNRWRSDPESRLVRAFSLPADRTFASTVTARLDLRADEQVLAELLGWTGTVANRHLTGVPAMGGWAATDGDPATSWTTPIGAAIGSTLTVPVDGDGALSSLRLRQPESAQLATITEVGIAGSGEQQLVSVPPPDAEGFSTISFAPVTAPSLTLTITATNGATTIDRRYANTVALPAAISELTGEGIVAAGLPQSIATGCRDDLLSVDDQPIEVEIQGLVAELLDGAPVEAKLCAGNDVELTSGEHVVRSAAGHATGIDIDRIVLRSGSTDPATESSPSGATSSPTVTVIDGDRSTRQVRVDECTDGCWLIFGEGFNTGWTASVNGQSLGPPSKLDGGFNGWYLEPSHVSRTINLTFDGQNTLTIGLVLSGLAVAACIALIVFDRRRRIADEIDEPRLSPLWPAAITTRPIGRSSAMVTTVVATVAGALVIAPLWGAICGVVALLGCFVARRPALLGYVAVFVAFVVAIVVTWRVVRDRPFANAGFPAEFADLHRLGMSVVVFLLASVCAAPDATNAPRLAVQTRPNGQL